MNKKVEIALKVIGCVAAAGLAVCVGIYAYKHRVVEVKRFPAIATIDSHDYRPPCVPHNQPARYYLHYTVDFEGRIYADNRENVGTAYFHGLYAQDLCDKYDSRVAFLFLKELIPIIAEPGDKYIEWG